MKSHELKPQDALLLLKLLSGHERLAQKELADDLGLSQAEISHSLRRLKVSQLIDSHRSVKRESALEFILYGLKYVFPAVVGPVAIGVPTAHSNPNFNFVRYDKNNILDSFVWPDPNGSVRGQSIHPIYGSVATAAKKDPKLHDLLSLVDMLRIGRARESAAASEALRERLAIS